MKCNNCNQDKPTSEFYQSNGKTLSECKECTKERNRVWRQKNKKRVSEYRDGWNKTTNGYRHRMWAAMKQRCESDPNYKKVQIKMTKQEWYDFATPLIEEFLQSNPDKIPSVDRIDPDGHYDTNNLRIISWEDNLTTSRVFLNKMGIDKKSSKEDKINALRNIIQGQCKILGMDYAKTIKEL